MLRTIGRILREESRGIDQPARYGGEEFVVALPETDPEGALELAERIRERIEAERRSRWSTATATIAVTASVGLATLPGAAVDVRELIGAADAALYEAKRTGKNRVVARRRAGGEPRRGGGRRHGGEGSGPLVAKVGVEPPRAASPARPPRPTQVVFCASHSHGNSRRRDPRAPRSEAPPGRRGRRACAPRGRGLRPATPARRPGLPRAAADRRGAAACADRGAGDRREPAGAKLRRRRPKPPSRRPPTSSARRSSPSPRAVEPADRRARAGEAAGGLSPSSSRGR